jgi:hypothetical protein
MIDTVLTAELYTTLVSAMSVATLWDEDGISVRKRKAGESRTRDTDRQSTTTAVKRI